MKRTPINFFQEDISYKISRINNLRSWIDQTITEEKHQLQELNFILCTDEYLLGINQQYLNHDTYTDIITFDNSEEENMIFGDIFISIERIKENAKTYGVKTGDEFARVVIHGVLHLLGYPDKTKEQKSLMTEKENYYLNKRHLITTEGSTI